MFYMASRPMLWNKARRATLVAFPPEPTSYGPANLSKRNNVERRRPQRHSVFEANRWRYLLSLSFLRVLSLVM